MKKPVSSRAAPAFPCKLTGSFLLVRAEANGCFFIFNSPCISILSIMGKRKSPFIPVVIIGVLDLPSGSPATLSFFVCMLRQAVPTVGHVLPLHSFFFSLP